MGNVSYLAHSNQFWINNLNEFKQELKGYVGGEWESEVAFNYTDFKRRSKNALISMSSSDSFCRLRTCPRHVHHQVRHRQPVCSNNRTPQFIGSGLMKQQVSRKSK